MKRRTQWIGVVALMAAGSVVAAWMVSLQSGSGASSLIELVPPDADIVVVADMQGLQSNPIVKKLLADPPHLSATAEYQQLLRESGFHYQDDLKQLAAAKLGDDWVGAAIVNVDRARMIHYLESQGATQTQEGGRVVYSFGAVRPFRLTFLKDNWIGFAVGANPALLDGVLDRFRRGSSAEPLRQGSDLESYPAGVALWIVARIDRLLAANPQGVPIGAFQLGKEWLEGSKTLVGVVNSGPLNLELHLDDRCIDAPTAARIAGSFQTALAILRAVPSGKGAAGNSDVATLLSALTIRPEASSVLVDWHATPEMLMALLGNRK